MRMRLHANVINFAVPTKRLVDFLIDMVAVEPSVFQCLQEGGKDINAYMPSNKMLLLHGNYARIVKSPPTGLEMNLGALEIILAAAFDGSGDQKELKQIIQQTTGGDFFFTKEDIMMLLTNVALFRAGQHKLKASTRRDHEWSNSIGKKFFLRLLEAVTPHYGLWVSFSTAGDFHQPGSSLLYIETVVRITKRRSRSSSSGGALNVHGVRHHPPKRQRMEPPQPPLACLEPLASVARLKPLASGARLEPVCPGAPLEPVFPGAPLEPVFTGAPLKPVVPDVPLKPVVPDAPLKPKRLRLTDIAPPNPPEWLSLPPDISLTRKLSVPDIIMFNRKGLVLFVWELKMYTHSEAEEQVNLSIFGNWRKGVLAMGGATSVGGIVTLFTYFKGVSRISITQIIPSYNLNKDLELKAFFYALLGWIKEVVAMNAPAPPATRS